MKIAKNKYFLFVMSALLLILSCNMKKSKGDLKISRFEYAPQKIAIGTGVAFRYSISNSSIVIIEGGNYNVELFIDDAKIAYDYMTSDIAPGSEVSYGMKKGLHHWVPNKSGKYKYRLLVSEKGGFEDISTKNNVLEGEIFVGEF